MAEFKKGMQRFNLLLGIIALGLMIVGLIALFYPSHSYAQEETKGVEVGKVTSAHQVMGWAFLAAAISVGLSCVGAGIAVSIVGSAAMGAVAERPELMGRSLVYVGLAEGIAIYGLIIGILILGKV